MLRLPVQISSFVLAVVALGIGGLFALPFILPEIKLLVKM
jgi:hypothetical protein